MRRYEDLYEKTARRDEQKRLLVDYRKALDNQPRTHEELVQMARAGDFEKAAAHFRGDQRKAFRSLLPAIDAIVEHSVHSSDALRKEVAGVRRATLIEVGIAAALTNWSA